jgi:hypothetical protein
MSKLPAIGTVLGTITGFIINPLHLLEIVVCAVLGTIAGELTKNMLKKWQKKD